MSQLNLTDLPAGTRIFYGGDMANIDGFGIITEQKSGKWGNFVVIKMDDGREFPNVPVCIFSDHYEGNGLTRFVTEKSYDLWREESLRVYQAQIGSLKLRLGSK